jgi:hypothetical protein
MSDRKPKTKAETAKPQAALSRTDRLARAIGDHRIVLCEEWEARWFAVVRGSTARSTDCQTMPFGIASTISRRPSPARHLPHELSRCSHVAKHSPWERARRIAARLLEHGSEVRLRGLQSTLVCRTTTLGADLFPAVYRALHTSQVTGPASASAIGQPADLRADLICP